MNYAAIIALMCRPIFLRKKRIEALEESEKEKLKKQKPLSISAMYRGASAIPEFGMYSHDKLSEKMEIEAERLIEKIKKEIDEYFILQKRKNDVDNLLVSNGSFLGES